VNAGFLLLAMFGSSFLLMLLGLPVGFCLGAVGMGFVLALKGSSGLVLPILIMWDWMRDFILIAIPLFLFMGDVLEKSGVADEMIDMMQRWFGSVRGGLDAGLVFICVIFAAMSGTMATATVALGILAIPSMLKRGYDKRLVLGTIMAGGTLGFLIPPSTTFIIYGMLAKVSIGRLFAGGMFPGLLLATLFLIYILVRCRLQPELGPVVPPEERPSMRQKLVSLRLGIPPLVIILSVLLTIFLGIASVSEAAALGVASTLIFGFAKGRLSPSLLKESLYRTARLTGMDMWIIYGALSFSVVYDLLGGAEIVRNMFLNLNLSPLGILIVMQLTFFLAGFVIDDVGFLVMVLPIYLPIVKELGFDPIWYGVLWCINSQMAFLTPPYGFSLFYLKAITGDLYRYGQIPEPITMGDIYRSVWPFVLLQAAGLVIVISFPQIALWLPRKLF